jgi:hypothetical protein
MLLIYDDKPVRIRGHFNDHRITTETVDNHHSQALRRLSHKRRLIVTQCHGTVLPSVGQAGATALVALALE